MNYYKKRPYDTGRKLSALIEKKAELLHDGVIHFEDEPVFRYYATSDRAYVIHQMAKALALQDAISNGWEF